jgi:DNA repair protein SbcD/Mre11
VSNLRNGAARDPLSTKFLITGDWHFKGINPRARLDNFQEAMMAKIFEVYQLASRHKVEAIIVPGDLTDSPGAMWGTVAELAALLQQAPCPVLTIHGNHDVWGGNPGSKFRTPYGFLARLGIIRDVDEDPYVKGNVSVSGHGFTVETDTVNGKAQYTPPELAVQTAEGIKACDDQFYIHVVHSMLMDHTPPFDMRHTLISQVETSARVVISGHLHTGFGSSYIAKRDDGVVFINPGALCRLSAHNAEMERPVQVALLDVNPRSKAFCVELIPLKSALPGHEVLSREHLENEVEREARLEKFLALLASEGESKFLEVRDIIEDIAARDNLPGNVKADALKRIGEAREQLGIGLVVQ